MLVLGASHLSISSETSSNELRSQALIHKVEAVKGLNAALSTPPKDRFEADARFAALMVLTFQSSCMGDGLIDFLTMLRGSVLGSAALSEDSYFRSLMENRHMETMQERLSHVQLEDIDTAYLDEVNVSLTNIEPLLQHDVEKRYHSLLLELVNNAFTSPKAGNCPCSTNLVFRPLTLIF